MLSDQEFKRIFKENGSAAPDAGFTERVMRRLPERANVLPQAVMLICVFAGLALTIAVQGAATLPEQIGDLISSVGRLQMPAAESVMAYLGGAATAVFIGFAVARVDAE